jgi:hypothetical protein
MMECVKDSSVVSWTFTIVLLLIPHSYCTCVSEGVIGYSAHRSSARFMQRLRHATEGLYFGGACLLDAIKAGQLLQVGTPQGNCTFVSGRIGAHLAQPPQIIVETHIKAGPPLN